MIKLTDRRLGYLLNLDGRGHFSRTKCLQEAILIHTLFG